MTFAIDALSALQEKGYTKHCHPLSTLSNTVDVTSKNVERKVCFFKWFGLFLLTLIPIFSALLSILVSLKSSGPSWLPAETIIFPLSLALALLTILNSIFKPGEKFREVCLIGIGIERFSVDFLVSLERMPKVDESSLLELIDKKRKEFEAYEIKLIGLFMPMEVAAQQAAAADAKIMEVAAQLAAAAADAKTREVAAQLAAAADAKTLEAAAQLAAAADAKIMEVAAQLVAAVDAKRRLG